MTPPTSWEIFLGIAADCILLIFGALILIFGVVLVMADYVTGVLPAIPGAALVIAVAFDIRALVSGRR